MSLTLTPEQFGTLAQGMGLFVLLCALLTGIAFVKQWGWRFRLVGITSFSVVLTVGLFALSLAPITRASVPGALPYTLVYDRYGPEATIVVPADITAEHLEATLRQAAVNLFSPGRSGQGRTDKLTIRARVVAHPRAGVSMPIYIGQVERSLRRRDDPEVKVTIFTEALRQVAQIGNVAAQPSLP